jgi:beta-barrel assembly-enhancing protease
MRGNMTWLSLVASALVFTCPVRATDDANSASPAGDPSVTLRAAFAAFDRKDVATAETAVLAVLNNPTFAVLDEATRHMALAFAAQVMLQTGKPVKAQQYAIQATQLPQQDLDDWRNRLRADLNLQDPRDEAECVTAIFRQWGADTSVLPDDTVFRVFGNTKLAELSDERLRMLEALYQRRWHPADGRSASSLWRELSRLLLEAKEPDRAGQVAVLVDEPDDIIAMRADNRLQSLLKSPFVQSNAQHAARDRIKTLQERVHRQPRSLRNLQYLLIAMATERKDEDVLALTADVNRRVQEAGTGAAPYDDFAQSYSWILDARAQALRHLGRYDEAAEALRRATELPDRVDTVSQPINLAALLCELDRPEEALALLPNTDKVSAFGRMQIESIRLSAAIELGRDEDATQALSYLREHRADSPLTLQRALLRAGALDEAEQWLLSRLSDPMQRTGALLEMQHYYEPPRPPLAVQWHDVNVALRARPAVRAAILKVGEIDSYQWRYNTYD